jgi:hypothetical protein
MRYGMLAALCTTVLVLSTTGRAAAQQAMPDLRGTWKGQSESVVRSGGGNTHHAATGTAEPRFTSVPFTIKACASSAMPRVTTSSSSTDQPPGTSTCSRISRPSW